MKPTKKRTKLTLSEVETQMEVLTKEEMQHLKGGGEPGSVVIFIHRIRRGNNCNDNPNDDWTISTYSGIDANGEYFGGYIMEPGGNSTTSSGQDRPIPPGTYNLYHNPTNKGSYGLYNEEVYQIRGIKIHKGNTGNDTEGCLLPGENVKFGSDNNCQAELINSTGAYNDIMSRIQAAGYENVEIIITEEW